MNRILVHSAIVALSLVAVVACSRGRDAATDSAAGAAADTARVPAPAVDTTTAAVSAASAAPGTLLNPDSATRDQLLAIPGIDAALADSLIAKRPYADMRAVDRVLGARLSEPQRDTVYTRLFKPLDPNKASKEEIELIPGVGPRMRHEFEEYRPWKSVEQFRREIGKYVDAKEVARLEQYIVIRQ